MKSLGNIGIQKEKNSLIIARIISIEDVRV